MNPYEVRPGPGTGCPGGRPLQVTATSAATAHTLHTIAEADAVDKVWVEGWNSAERPHPLFLVISPAGTSGAQLTAATIVAELPHRTPYELLGAHALQQIAGGPYAIGVYTDADGSGNVAVTCTVTRFPTGGL